MRLKPSVEARLDQSLRPTILYTALAVAAVSIATTCFAALSHRWSFEELKAKASLVVIGVPIKVTASGQSRRIENSTLLGQEMETVFQAMTTLKGDLGDNTLILHHFSLKPGSNVSPLNEPPRLVSFEPKDRRQYLMFLSREGDGSYAAVSGQYMAADSIHVLPKGHMRVRDRLD